MKPSTIIFFIITLLLAFTLVLTRHKAEADVKALRAQNIRSASQLEDAKIKLVELEKISNVLQTNLVARDQQLDTFSNMMAKATAELGEAQKQIKNLLAELSKRESQIAELQARPPEVKIVKMEEPAPVPPPSTVSLEQLEKEIAEIKSQLQNAEGDRDFLIKQLKLLEQEKSLLVKQFNDMAALRAQMAKLREEDVIKQRMDWRKLGIYATRDKKGAERLLASSPVVIPPDPRLIVELEQPAPAQIIEDPSVIQSSK